MRPKIDILCTAIVLGLALEARADLLDRVNDALSIRDSKHQFQLQLSGLIDFEGYFIDQRAPGLIEADHGFLFNPRLSIFADVQWTNHFYFFGQVRVDRHFDPSDQGAQIRFDEYFLRYTPLDNSRISFQIGKFATVVGNWVPRHLSWENPFINAPLPYENVTGIWDIAAPPNVDALFYWGHVGEYESGDYSDKYLRLPIIWGPSYASGFAVLGTIDKFDYAFELKNSALSSRPEAWDATQIDFDNPTFSGRVGFRPSEMWNFGCSVSSGAYLLPVAAPTLPTGRSISDYRELVLAQDVAFAWHHLQLWAEFYETRFQVPNVGQADTFAYYLEAKYKITPQLFAALRWNQQLFGTVRDADKWLQWGNDVSRVDAAVGYRFTNYLQGKIQYSFSHTDAKIQVGEQLIAAQLTIKF
ncbi:MAG TPA: hypothetical protein VEP30_11360 [Chthoniobacterales bacterium]|nr:hypothetical protein [Chthoniobacterales bacterium]